MSDRDSISASKEKPVEYRDVPGLPGYRVGSDGSVWGIRKWGFRPIQWRKLSPFRDRAGRLYIKIKSEEIDKPKNRSVHRLVLEAFSGPCPDGMECCHNNGNPTDNRPENLRWDTKLNNQSDRVTHGTSNRGERSWRAKLTKESVVEIVRRYESGESGTDLAVEFGIHKNHVYRLARKERWPEVFGIEYKTGVRND